MAQVYREARLLLLGLGVGIVLMMVYDGLRLLRFLFPHKNLFLYRENDGALRFYMIGSIFCSMLFYDRIISRNLRKVLKWAVRCIRMKLRR